MFWPGPSRHKDALFQVPSSVVDGSPGGNDSAEMFKLQNPLFQHALKEDLHFATQVKSLELLLQVRDRVGHRKGGSPSRCKREVTAPSVSESEFDVTATTGKQKNGVVTGSVETDAVPALLECAAGPTAGESKGTTALLEFRKSDFSMMDGVAVAAATAGAFATAGESKQINALLEDLDSDRSMTDGDVVALATAGESRNLGLRPVTESHSRHNSSWGVGVVTDARVSALPGVSATSSSSASAFVSAAVAHARSTPMHDAHNSCSDTAMNSLRVQRCRKVLQSRTVGIRSVEQTVDMSPAPAAGTYRRSAGTVHAQGQVPRECLAESSGVGPGPGTVPGGRSGLVGGNPGLAVTCLEIPCSLVMPPGRHQFAPQSLGWARVCGTEESGVWVQKEDART